MALELMLNFEAKYIRNVLIREDADDILTLKFQRISLDEHYAMLYGPSMIAHDDIKEAEAEAEVTSNPTSSTRRGSVVYTDLDHQGRNSPIVA
jgi:hypothetical protein